MPRRKTSCTASCGGLWQSVVYGFGGLRMLGGKLRIDPKLPEAWKGLRYRFYWRGERLAVEITKERVSIVNETAAAPVEIEIRGQVRRFTDRIDVEL